MKTGIKIIGIIVLIAVIAFGLELAGLEWTRFFAPKRANIEREVFENTKSFTHGKIKELAKHYQEYNEVGSADDRQIIKNVIRESFADFDKGKINTQKLKDFLTEMRGY